MKLTIQSLGQSKQIQTKFGLKDKSYIKAKEYGDNYLSYWVGQDTLAWKVGDVIEAEVKSREYNGKTYYDLVLPKKGGFSNEKLDGVHDMMLFMKDDIEEIKKFLVAKLGKVEPEKDPNAPVYPTEELEPPF